MGLLDDQLASDASIAFIDVLSETIVYTPRNGSPKTIQAVVNRQQSQPVPEGPPASAPSIIISIANDATVGVTSVDRGGDRVLIPINVGAMPVSLGVFEIVNQDTGIWTLRLR